MSSWCPCCSRPSSRSCAMSEVDWLVAADFTLRVLVCGARQHWPRYNPHRLNAWKPIRSTAPEKPVSKATDLRFALADTVNASPFVDDAVGDFPGASIGSSSSHSTNLKSKYLRGWVGCTCW